MDLTLTREQMERLSQQIASRVVSLAIQLRHFFLVEDLVDSLKVPRNPHSLLLPPGFPIFSLLPLAGGAGGPLLGKFTTWGVPLGSADPHPHPQLALLFYILTFVGAVFNGLTLLILGELGRVWGAGGKVGHWGLWGPGF